MLKCFSLFYLFFSLLFSFLEIMLRVSQKRYTEYKTNREKEKALRELKEICEKIVCGYIDKTTVNVSFVLSTFECIINLLGLCTVQHDLLMNLLIYCPNFSWVHCFSVIFFIVVWFQASSLCFDKLWRWLSF